MVTGMRGLCNGLGPAMFGVIFYLFHVDLNEDNLGSPTHSTIHIESYADVSNITPPIYYNTYLVVH